MNRIRITHLLASLLAGTTMVAAACNRTEPPQNTDTTTPAGATPRGDEQLVTDVHAKFYTADEIRSRHIDVAAQDSVVTLRGTVPDQATKERAVAVARSVDGVTYVNDHLQVAADPATASAASAAREEEAETQPGWITTKIQAQYFLDPDIRPWNIDVTTRSGGIVTLEGSVDSAENKADAVRIARQTEGVTRVDDRLRVAPSGSTGITGGVAPDQGQPDPWLTAKIQAKYYMDNDVKGRRIDVDTRDGIVTLRGTVGSEAERRQAIALARNTDGVRELRDELRVDTTTSEGGGAERDRRRTVADIERPDGWITTKIQAQYFLDPEVKAHQINVDTRNGVVTLKGFVETAAQRNEAEQIARETEGVGRVVNQLSVGVTGN